MGVIGNQRVLKIARAGAVLLMTSAACSPPARHRHAHTTPKPSLVPNFREPLRSRALPEPEA
jgi:hypothetical protein